MWIGALISYPIALYQNYNLLVSDYFGIAALVVLAFVNFIKPSILLKALSIVLLIGSFNLISFVYFINLVMEFGIAGYVSPGIQLISSFLLVILHYRKEEESSSFFLCIIYWEELMEKEKFQKRI